MANPTTNFGWVMPTSTDLVTDLPADFNVFGQGVDTSMQYLLGGTTGQVLSKTSGTNMAFTWVTPTDQTPLTTKGDLFTFSTVDARLAVGTNKYVLGADSTQSTGLAWQTSPQSIMTTTGDTLYASAANTPARLGIGSTGQVLTVAAGIPSWATPSSSLPALVGVNLSKAGVTTTLTASVISYLTFTTEIYDTNTFHDNSTNTTRITIPSGYGGKYLFTGAIGLGGAGSNTFEIFLRKNGATDVVPGGRVVFYPNNAGNTAAGSFGIMIELVATDYIELGIRVAATSSSYTLDSLFQATYLGA